MEGRNLPLIIVLPVGAYFTELNQVLFEGIRARAFRPPKNDANIIKNFYLLLFYRLLIIADLAAFHNEGNNLYIQKQIAHPAAFLAA